MRGMAAFFAMDGATWARHANPWSVWTRVPIGPLLCLAVWARVWFGAWCLMPVAALLLWAWVNPRAFPPPREVSSWASRAVLGERMWLARGQRPIPEHHAAWAAGLSAGSAAGLPVIAWGLWALEPWPVVFGLAVSMLAKFWFLDRMVWLHADMTAGRTG